MSEDEKEPSIFEDGKKGLSRNAAVVLMAFILWGLPVCCVGAVVILPMVNK
jgi:hypothetical protein